MMKQYRAWSHAVKNLGVDYYIHEKESHLILAPYKPLHDTAAGKRALGKGRDSFQVAEAASKTQLRMQYSGSYKLPLKATSYYVE
jgi:hypothetical protein